MMVLDLFSGIGGFSLGLERAGMKTVAFCEIDPFCRKVLKKHWPDVPIHEDIKTLKGDEVGSVDVVCGGFPCQPFSCAGKRKGKEDDRYLWPEMLRVVSEAKPRWVIGENVAGFIGMGLDDCVSDLENQGYETQAFVIPACAVNAPHRRDRVWIVANRKNIHEQWTISERGGEGRSEVQIRNENCHVTDTESRKRLQGHKDGSLILYGEAREECGGSSVDAADSGNQRLQGSAETRNYGIDGEESSHKHDRRCTGWQEPWLEAATRLCGIFNGLSRELDENRGLNYAEIAKRITGQDMPCLWEGFQQESLQWSFGRFNTVSFKENVFTVLWKLFAKPYRSDNLPFESATVQEAFLRNMWIGNKFGCPSQGWRYQEQYAREHSDALSQLSYEIALVASEATERFSLGRVDRLRALGNSVVPLIPEIIGRCIMKIESSKMPQKKEA